MLQVNYTSKNKQTHRKRGQIYDQQKQRVGEEREAGIGLGWSQGTDHPKDVTYSLMTLGNNTVLCI